MVFLNKEKATPFSLGFLSADKLKLFEDGKQQQIESVHEETHRDIQVWLDNLGAHREQALEPRGIWSTSDQAPAVIAENAEFSRLFLITYSPPASPEGSCHTIGVKPHEGHLVFSKKYCNGPPSALDPLQGTPEDRELEGYFSAGRQGSFHPLVQGSTFYDAPGKARVNIDIELPFDEVRPKNWKDGTLPSTLLIEAYGKDGRVAGRDSEHVPEDAEFAYLDELEKLKEASSIVTSTRYDGQMDLPPGEYKLAIAYRRGKDFGIAEVPLTVDDYDGSQFAISSIALCKRVRKAGTVPVAREFRAAGGRRL